MSRYPLSAAAIEVLEDRKLLHAPELDAVPSYNAPVGKVLYVPLTATYDHADAVTYSAKSSTGNIAVGIRSTKSTWIEMQVSGYSQPMVFQLFDNVAPKTVKTMVGLVKSGYFDGQAFHRVIDKFVLQAGDPKSRQPFDADDNAWGTGGPGFSFDDEFNSAAVFTGDGQLAMANSGKDTNGSQFFITEGPQRALDFNHTVWGQLVRGKATRDAISNVATDDDGRPDSDVRITRMRVIANTTDAVLVVNPRALATGTITVTASSAQGSDRTSFAVAAAADKVNDPPVLIAPPPVLYTAANTPLVYKLSGFDLEGNPIDYQGQFVNGAGADPAKSTIKDGILTVTPKSGFTGKITLYVGAGVANAQSRGSTQLSQGQPLGGVYDSQLITIAVGDAPIRATAVTVDALTGAPVTNAVVATFVDTDRRGTAANFTASINWGDGAVTSGTVVRNANGLFSVLGTHAYAEGSAAGNYPVTVDITGNLGAAARVESVASVKPLASVKGGILTVNGTNAADKIGLGVKNGKINVTVNRVTRAFDVASVTEIRVYGYDGSDLLAMAETGTIGALLDGGLGNDVLLGGEGADILRGGAGRDTIDGRSGNDRAAGGTGNDTINGGLGKDKLFGQDGNDFVSGDGSNDVVSGDGGNDTLLGGGGGDNVQGGGGNDVINVFGGGTDVADGGPGTNVGKYDDRVDTIARLVFA
ncbi:MAG TPA: peptidylprolyl isomerase [Tepidisphaeraceae bacterium]|jgi:cyclophilin family peptidyl-prolyl cis-trans isomerase